MNTGKKDKKNEDDAVGCNTSARNHRETSQTTLYRRPTKVGRGRQQPMHLQWFVVLAAAMMAYYYTFLLVLQMMFAQETSARRLLSDHLAATTTTPELVLLAADRRRSTFLPKPAVVHLHQDGSVLMSASPQNSLYRTTSSLPQRNVALEDGIQPQQQQQQESSHNHYYYDIWRRGDQYEGCEALAEWQSALHETCSMMHELEMTTSFHLVGSGYYRHVWAFREYDGTKRALKTIRYDHDHDDDGGDDNGDAIVEMAENHRVEAVALERLSASPYVSNMYSYCVNSAVFDFADGGDLKENFLYGHNNDDSEELPAAAEEEERLQIAHDVARALADLHHVDGQGRVTMAHTDIKPSNFVSVHGRYQLNDLNRAEMLSWYPDGDAPCGFWFEHSEGRWRSPEEYGGKQALTEKIDVWSLGHVLFVILTGRDPWNEIDSDRVAEMVKKYGARPIVRDKRILESDHIFHRTMLRALDMCFTLDPNERPSARQVADLFGEAIIEQFVEETGDEWKNVEEQQRIA